LQNLFLRILRISFHKHTAKMLQHGMTAQDPTLALPAGVGLKSATTDEIALHNGQTALQARRAPADSTWVRQGQATKHEVLYGRLQTVRLLTVAQ
jgi:hypothetical protein